MNRGDCFVGALLGTALGDAVGLPAEGLSAQRIKHRWPDGWKHRLLRGRGMVSDDTEHTVMVAQALIAAPRDATAFQRELARRLGWWFVRLPAGVGLATARSCLNKRTMNKGIELAANALNALSILLAAFNSVHTWWAGIAGCLLFAWVFFGTQLYADVTLQAFFIVTSVLGWRNWLRGNAGSPMPVRRTPRLLLGLLLLAGALVAAGYGWLLHHFTDAYAPFLDSVVLAFSVLGQLLLMRRHYESWWCWLLVNSIAVPLYLTRGLAVTAILYAAFWINAVVALVRWRKLIQPA